MPRIFAYVRVSTSGQTTGNQVREIEAAGFTIEPRRVAAAQRPGFVRLLDRLETGDTLVVTKLDRLGRNAMDVRATVDRLPTIAEAHAVIMRFQAMIRTRADDDLDPWTRDAGKSQIASFARGILKDKAAVRAAIKEPCSNGQIEGQVNRLKLIKRQMYGRAKVDLIEARLRGAA